MRSPGGEEALHPSPATVSRPTDQGVRGSRGDLRQRLDRPLSGTGEMTSTLALWAHQKAVIPALTKGHYLLLWGWSWV